MKKHAANLGFRSWRHALRHLTPRRRTEARRGVRNAGPRTLLVESLEDRTLLSADLQTGLGGNEPAIAVHPTDPNVVAVAQFRTIFISRDGGATFPGGLQVNVPTLAGYAGGGGDPSLAFDSQGRLYFSYLASNQAPANASFFLAVFAARIDNVATGTPTIAQNQFVAPETNTDHHDKEWIAVDSNPSSPFRDNAYVVWSQLGNNQQIMFSRSVNGGATWSAPSPISVAAVAGGNAGNGFTWPSHLAVAPNGDLYVGWHNDTCGSPNASMTILRDSAGGADLANADGGGLNPVQSSAFPAAVTCNVQDASGDEVPLVNAWMQGALQPFILPDPLRPGQIYVVANDDPNNNFGNGDDGDVILARSTDNGNSWSLSTISHAPAGTLQAYPTGTIDEIGNITVSWYDTRRGLVGPGEDVVPGNGDDTFLMDLYHTVSTDGGVSFTNDFRVNDQAFDPTVGAPCRFGPQANCGTVTPGTARTLRIGEYNGVAASNGMAYTSWTGNGAGGQEIFVDKYSLFGPFPDRYEVNDSLSTATVLGSLPKITLQDLSLHQTDDVDFFKVTAQDTGKLLFNLFFDHANPNVNAGVADLSLTVRDVNGNTIATGTQAVVRPSLAVEHIEIPVVSQEEYFIEVNSTADIVDNPVEYDLEIENFPAPVPLLVDLGAATDAGCYPDDNVTNDDTPTFTIVADLANFVNADETPPDEIAVLTPAQAAAGNVPGVAVQVFIDGVAAGYASALLDNVAFTFTAAAPLSNAPHVVQAAVRVFDGQTPNENGRTDLSPPLLLTIDTAGPSGATGLANFDLNDSSDSGTSDDDYVTNKMEPAFKGEAEAGAIVRIYAAKVINNVAQPRELVGVGVAGSDRSDGDTDGRGLFEITVEPLVDSLYDITVELEDCAQNVTQFDPDLNTPGAVDIEIDTLAPNLPFLDLIETSDTGRHNDDNVTNDNTPSLSMTTEDRTASPTDFSHKFAANLIYRVFDRPENSPEALVFDSFAVLADFTAAVQAITTLNALADGIHDFKLEVEDRAGNISDDFLLDVLIDTVAPPVSILRIDPATTDTGVPGDPTTIVDRATSDTATGFVGRAEANAIVRLYVDAVANDAINHPVEYSLTVALPYDGDEVFPNGQWATSFVRDLNDPALFPVMDGLREVLITAEDLAGNVNTVSDGLNDAGQILDIFIDTQGPRVFDPDGAGGVSGIHIPDDPGTLRDESLYHLFDPKPSVDGPTPLIHSLVVHIEDLPLRVAPDFLYDALFEAVAEHVGNYSVVGDHNGPIAIESVDFNAAVAVPGQSAKGTITITFVAPLPDDRLTLTISDSLMDPVGNALDGESNAVEPHDTPDIALPSGDGVPGGQFVARFTVDSRAEIGVWGAGSVYVDSNGNFVADPEGKDGDEVNEDVTYVLGFTSDNVFAGNFAAGGAAADGFHKLAAYGKLGKSYRWLIDDNNDGVPDQVLTNPVALNGLPAAGDFDGDPNNGDEVALKVGSAWYVDQDHSLTVDNTEKLAGTNMIGYPIVGDFDGDGKDDLGTRTDDVFSIDFASDGLDGTWDVQFKVSMNSAFIGPQERPIAADFDGDGIDDIGLWVPRHSGGTPQSAAEWYILVSDGRSILDRFRDNPQNGGKIVDFVPVPFGKDEFAVFGTDTAPPVVGNFDPHHIQVPLGGVAYGLTNWDDAHDVNGDGLVTANDVLILINEINGNGQRGLLLGALGGPFFDVNRDSQLTAADVLAVINRVNLGPAGAVDGEGEGGTVYAAPAVPPTASSWAQAATTGLSGSADASRTLAASDVDQLYTPARKSAAPVRADGESVQEYTASPWDDADGLELDDLLSDVASAKHGARGS